MVEFYLPIERDTNIPKEEKLGHMLDWWQRSNDLIVKTKITQDSIQELIQDSITHLKSGCKPFFKCLEDHDIPLVVFSAGLGDIIKAWIDHECGTYKNMKIVANFMKFDEETKQIVGFEGKLIHIFNKHESVLLGTDFEKKIENRSNVILLGDSLGDVDMAMGIASKSNVIKVGFLNDKVEELLPIYMDSFDIVTIKDDTFDIPNAVLKAIL